MKKVERKLNRPQLITVWLLIISVLLTGAYITISMIAKRRAANKDDESSVITELKDGEALSSTNIPLAYPAIAEKNITDVDIERIENSKTEERFGIFREPDANGQPNGQFLFKYYEDGSDVPVAYYPPISGEDPNFDYKDLYSVEGGDGFGQMYFITYLCSALGNPMFSERIELPMGDDEASIQKRFALLRDCGITETKRTDVLLTFCQRDDKTNEVIKDSEKTILVRIGGKAISGAGFYFMVIEEDRDRPYIYYTNSEYLSYALKSFSEYVKGTLISGGLTNDAMYGPYLTTNFTKWKGQTYKEGAVTLKEDRTKYQYPLVVGSGRYNRTKAEGYDTGSGALKFDLEALRDHSDFTRIKNALVGKTVGVFDSPIILTLIDDLSASASPDRMLEFSTDVSSLTYQYKITKIESVITDTEERVSGTVGAGDRLLKITYSYTVGDVTKNGSHAVIDRSNLAAEDSAKLNGKEIGADLSASPVEITVTYTRDNALQTSYKYTLRTVEAIFDEKGELTDEITENTYVNISYDVYVNGKYEETKTHPIRLADFSEKHKLYRLKEILLGNGVGDYNHTIYEDTALFEYMREFSTYEISSIDSFTVNEIVVSFAFQNASERNPYYGESLYVNLLQNEHKIYGLNAGSCEEVVKLLGGIGSNSSGAAGLFGTTVAIGLTAENMNKYGLYTHKVYFEMPRLIYDASEGTSEDNADMLSDFAWIDTIGFTLYISDSTYDENGIKVRYIGSDMYDIVVKVQSNDFDFVEYDFIEFWARKSLVMMDITKLDELKFDFYMQELTGSYDFDVDFRDGYSGYINGELIFSEEKREGLTAVKKFQSIDVTASPDAFQTKFKELYGDKTADLAWLYQQTLGGGKTNYYPGVQDTTYGAAYFNSAYSILQLIGYLDTLTAEEQEAGFLATKVMSMSLKVEGQEINGEEFYYTYDFYRLDDRRIMVALYKSNANGDCIDDSGNVVPSDRIGEYTVSDFYIDAFSFKKLVNAYIQLLEGNEFDENLGYPTIH